jgi:hypothetical protein
LAEERREATAEGWEAMDMSRMLRRAPWKLLTLRSVDSRYDAIRFLTLTREWDTAERWEALVDTVERRVSVEARREALADMEWAMAERREDSDISRRRRRTHRSQCIP